MKGNRTLPESHGAEGGHGFGGGGSCQRVAGRMYKSFRLASYGFTLVELLVVVVIIGLLAALISTAVISAIGKAREARVLLEIRAIEAAFHAFKERYGEFPPSTLQDEAKVTDFLRRAFPRYAAKYGTNLYTQFLADTGLSPASSPAELLVFWLSGISEDPEHPFQGQRKPLFDFVKDRLQGGRYYPDLSGAKGNAPYVYFRAADYEIVGFNTGQWILRPYQRREYYEENGQYRCRNEWFNPSTFQIISAGRDNMYGGTLREAGDPSVPPYDPMNPPSPTEYKNFPPARFPTSRFSSLPSGLLLTNFDETNRPGHLDNLTNFLEGKIENAIKQ
jgi:prepilin-type N-terminal cleavage/methylation domain-containing protein